MRLLDLFCGAGGAGAGYYRAGLQVVGVDLAPQPNYPFRFVEGDALEVLESGFWRSFDVIHASPPCQGYTGMNNRHGSSSPKLIPQVRELLQATGLPYVIENVAGARSSMIDPYALCGKALGLGVHRHRLFETSFPMLTTPCPGRVRGDDVPVYGKLDGRLLWRRSDGSELRAPKSLTVASEAMGIDWMVWDELRESIPPAFTEYIAAWIPTLAKETTS